MKILCVTGMMLLLSKVAYADVVATPVLSPAAGTYYVDTNITMTSATPGATIRYLTNGSSPNCTTSGTVYTAPVAVVSGSTFRAIACLTGSTPSAVTASATYILKGTVPVFSPAPGTFTTDTNITLTTATTGATIRYTTGGTTPTCTNGTLYTAPFPAVSETIYKAISCKTSWTASDPTVSSIYTLKVVTPTFSPAPSTYNADTNITLTTTTAGATIRYTTGGTTPTCLNGTLYTAPFPAVSGTIYKAIGCKNGWTPSDPTVSSTYTLKVVTPTFSPAPSTYNVDTNITLTTTTAGATIRYTTGGSTPTCTSGTLYSAPFPAVSGTIYRAIGCKTGWTPSDPTASSTYTLKVVTPIFSPVPSTYYVNTNITLSTTTTGATIRYTTGGTTPTCLNGTLYSSPIPVVNGTVYRAIGCKTGWTDSDPTVLSTYVLKVAKPVVTPGTSTVNNNPQVTITTTTPGANLKHGTNTTTPNCTTNGTAYTQAFSLAPPSTASPVTFKAIGCKTGFTPSDLSDTISYTFKVGTVTLSPNGGNYNTAQNVVATTVTSGATFKYTIDGSSPTCATGIAYPTGGIPINASVTLKVIGCKTNYLGSDIAQATFVLKPNTPTITPAAATFNNAQSVTMATTTAGSTIRYTSGATAPTDPTCTTGTVYSVAVPLAAPTTIFKAIACKTGWTGSTILTSGSYLLKVANVVMSPAAGTFAANQTVTLTTATTGATFKYTLDGTTPTCSTGISYTAPVLVDGTKTLKAVGCKTGYSDSALAQGTYTLKPNAPTISPAAATFNNARTVTFASTTAGSTIRYTSGATAPTDPTCTTGTVYSSAVPLAAPTTIFKAIACKNGWTGSTVLTSGSYLLKVANVVLTPAAGNFAANQSVVLSSSTTGATFKYTLNGTTPTCTTGTSYTTAILIDGTKTLKAIGCKTGYSDSALAQGTYTLKPNTPTITPAAGTFNNAQSVTMATTTAGSTIRYTSGATAPTDPTCTTGTVYSAAVPLVAPTTIFKAIACKSGWTGSAILTSGSYLLKVANLAMSPAAGTFAANQTVTLTTATTGATIKYTLDNSTPTCTTGTSYTAPVLVDGTKTLKAIGCKTGYSNSALAQGTYTLKPNAPTISPAAGTFNNAQSVTIATTTAGSTIRYTSGATTPTDPTCTTGTVYAAAIPLVAPTTIFKAIACKTGWTGSTILTSGSYLLKVANVVMSPAAGTFAANQSVTLTTATSGATFKYTLDGTNPTCTTGTSYTAPILIDGTKTLKAIGCKTGYSESALAQGTYTLKPNTPTITPAAGTFNNAQSVTMATTTAGSTIRYTSGATAPTDPTCTTGTVYTAVVPLAAPNTIFKVIACKSGWTGSTVLTSGSYILKAANVVFAPAATTFTTSASVTMTTATPAAQIRYTTGTTVPTCTTGTVYSAAIVTSATTTYNAIACKTNYAPSTVVNKTYTKQ